MNRKYYWRRWGYSGEAGEIPGIMLDDRDKLPPIEKAFFIKVDILFSEIEKSNLTIEWLTEEGVRLQVRCDVNNERLKEQFREKPAFLDKVIDFLMNCPEEPKEREVLKVEEKITASDIQQDLRPFVNQIKIWDDFLETFRRNNSFNFRYRADVSNDGYYRFVINSYHLRLPAQKDYPDELDELAVFDFNPQKRPPQVNEKYIWWTIPDKKIHIILPHDSTSKRIVNHYSYRKAYEQFLEEEKRKKEEEDRRSQQPLTISTKERKEREEKLRKSLLS